MADQIPLWHEDINDAMKHLVAALGGAKTVGIQLRPEWEDNPNKAGGWVNDCINPDRNEKFNWDQIFWLLKKGRETGCHAAMHFLARECGYTEPHPVEPEDERAKLQRAFISMGTDMKRMLTRLEALDS